MEIKKGDKTVSIPPVEFIGGSIAAVLAVTEICKVVTAKKTSK